MKFSCSRDALINALSIAQKGVSNKTTLPVLEGILFQVYNNQLVLTSTDLEIGVQTSIPANVDMDGEIILSSNLITEVIRKLSGEEAFFPKRRLKPGKKSNVFCQTLPLKDSPPMSFQNFRKSLRSTVLSLKQAF